MKRKNVINETTLKTQMVNYRKEGYTNPEIAMKCRVPGWRVREVIGNEPEEIIKQHQELLAKIREIRVEQRKEYALMERKKRVENLRELEKRMEALATEQANLLAMIEAEKKLLA